MMDKLKGLMAPKLSDYGCAAAAREAGMKYTVSDRPPAWETVLLGFQHYLTMLGATVVIPIIIVPAMGGSQKDLAQTINTIFFISGINTLVQTTLGDRLPIVQGGSFAYLTPTFGVIFSAQLQSIEDPELRFRTTMQTIQGAVIICGVVQVVMAMTGLLTLMLRFVSPLTIAPVVTAIGLGLSGVAFGGIGKCPAVGLVQVGTIILFSQYMKDISIGGIKPFALFPVLLGIIVTWIYALAMTEGGVWSEGYPCRTDNNLSILYDAPWFRVPYPTQWGAPKFEAYAIVPFLGAMFASMVESIGGECRAAGRRVSRRAYSGVTDWRVRQPRTRLLRLLRVRPAVGGARPDRDRRRAGPRRRGHRDHPGRPLRHGQRHHQLRREHRRPQHHPRRQPGRGPDSPGR